MPRRGDDIKHHRSEIDQALRESEEKYRKVVEHSLQGLFVIQDFRFIFCNTAFAEMSGYSVDELTALTPDKLPEIIHPDDREWVMGRLRDRLLGKEVPNRLEFRGLHKDGSIRWMDVAAATIEYGGSPALQGATVDITDKKQAEDALRESEQKYRHLIQASNDGIYLLYNRRFEVVNQKFLKMFNITLAEVEHPDFDFIHLVAPQSRSLIEDRIRRAARGEKLDPNYDFTALVKGVGEIEVETSVTYIPYQDGIAVQGIVRDISERKRLEEQLLQAQKLESIGRLAGGIAHDFNNLLTSIIGYVGLLQMRMEGEDPNHEYIRQIQKAADRASTLIQQLLAFSRKAMSQPRVMDLNQVIDNFKKMLQRVLGEDIELRFIPGKNLYAIEADPIQIEQIIMNLAINSRDAMPQGGKLTIETKNKKLRPEYVRKYPELNPGDYTQIMFSDNGSGMDEEILSHIFEPFFTTKEKGTGTGLGLSTVYGIVRQNGGHITLYSEVGRGTTFEIYLPRVDKPTEDVSSAPNMLVLPRGGETIQVVEDDRTVREMVVEILDQCGYKIFVAQSGEEALKGWKHIAETIDLVITDVVMPKMSGYELAKRLKKKKPGLKIIYMSGYTLNVVSRDENLGEKVNFIQKPFSPEDLAMTVRKVLDS